MSAVIIMFAFEKTTYHEANLVDGKISPKANFNCIDNFLSAVKKLTDCPKSSQL